jgi:histidyl-tRNA synthetase
MVRGLDYYTRTAFEVVHDELGRSKAVGGGGRYDTLLKELGGPDVSGIGFAIGLERLSMGIPDEDPRFARSIDAFVAIVGEKARNVAFKLINELRTAGVSVDARYSSKTLKSQMKAADKSGASTVIMIGDDELDRGEVTMRDMHTKEQVPIKMDKILAHLQGDKR